LILAFWLLDPDWLGQTWVRLAAAASVGLTVFLLGLVLWRTGLLGRRPPRTRSRPQSPQQAGPGNPQTAAGRERKCIAVEVEDVAGTLLAGWLVDRGGRDLILRLKGPVEAATLVTVRPARQPEPDAWVLMAVRSCQPDASAWRVVCRFLKMPPADVLTQFGCAVFRPTAVATPPGDT
jgi:hypothetical protein